LTTWKRVVLIAFGFGAGFAICAAAILGTLYWYSNRPKPWNNTAIKANFETMELFTDPPRNNYSVDFSYTLENTTRENYNFYPSNITIFANLAQESASASPSASEKNPAPLTLSKDFGDYQQDAPTIDGPPFIPAQNRARFHIKVTYQYPGTFPKRTKRTSTR